MTIPTVFFSFSLHIDIVSLHTRLFCCTLYLLLNALIGSQFGLVVGFQDPSRVESIERRDVFCLDYTRNG